MGILTFHGPSLNEAIADVRARLGKDAVILSWTRSDTGVALTVSTQAAADGVAPVDSGREGASADGEFDAWNNVARRKSTAPRHDVFAGEAADAISMATPVRRRATQSPSVAPAVTPAVSPDPSPGPRKVTAADLVATRPAARPAKPIAPATAAPVSTTPAVAPPSQLEQLLLRAGMERAIVERLQLGPTETGLRRALIDLFTDRLPVDPLDALPRTPVGLVGGPGSGKTVTAAKLAARAMAAGASVTLIGCDTGRSGGTGQLQGLAERLGCSFETAAQATQVRDIADAAWSQGNVVIVDTPAAAGMQSRDTALLVRLCEAARAEPLLCLPADMRSDDAGDLLSIWAAAGARRAIVTRLDLTRRRAGVLGALIDQQAPAIALSQMSDTPFIAGGLALATPIRLAAAMLELHDQPADATP
jgi:flagellar biosynthesis GTPase FlhF